MLHRATGSWFFALALLLGCSQSPARAVATPDVTLPPTADVEAIDRPPPPQDIPAAPDITAVRTTRDIVIMGTPMNAAERFGGTEDATRAPSIVYPEDQTIVPPNLPGIEVHFLPGGDNDLFEVSFTGDVRVVRVFTTCNRVAEGCVLTLNETLFPQIAEAARAGGAVRISVRGTNSGRMNGPVGRSPSRQLGMTQNDLRGGVYYWAVSGSIIRYDFGRMGARPEVYLTGNPIQCVGCHSLSRDGSRIAVGSFIPGPATAGILNAATREQVGATFGSNFGSFSPDNRRYLSSDGARMQLLDAATGMPMPGLASGTPGTMPDWSPNGDVAVFSRPMVSIPFGGSPGHNPPADLMLMRWMTSTFGPPSSLVHSEGENNYYPSFSPDGNWVLFNRSAGGSDNAPDAHLWAIRANGMGGPVDLARANGTGAQGNSWPKWAPFREMYSGELTEPLMWITFSSHRDYGLRLRNSSRAMDSHTVQLWMAAFRPDRVNRPGDDPTSPAFWLPFQDMGVGNHIAQWTEIVQRTECMTNQNCRGGEYCQNNRCVGAPP